MRLLRNMYDPGYQLLLSHYTVIKKLIVVMDFRDLSIFSKHFMIMTTLKWYVDKMYNKLVTSYIKIYLIKIL